MRLTLFEQPLLSLRRARIRVTCISPWRNISHSSEETILHIKPGCANRTSLLFTLIFSTFLLFFLSLWKKKYVNGPPFWCRSARKQFKSFPHTGRKRPESKTKVKATKTELIVAALSFPFLPFCLCAAEHEHCSPAALTPRSVGIGR